jgi:thioredoxin-related protein
MEAARDIPRDSNVCASNIYAIGDNLNTTQENRNLQANIQEVVLKIFFSGSECIFVTRLKNEIVNRTKLCNKHHENMEKYGKCQ